ncbi:DUF1080 domain-containing protein [Chryseolinea sp. H1M3-3]|uniref:3-keto-disaccharide hydrolase n=1 Tax=Chryseolinea sp. H1M3-3 TaxID=3034144 RepID=UPI0023EAF526|nr:DUF1080 domain-containing protein [Chryseolinea sp. H1M3-3]
MIAKPIVLQLFIFIFFIGISEAQERVISANKSLISLSAIKGTTSRCDTLILFSNRDYNIRDIKIAGTHASYFRLTNKSFSKISVGKPAKIALVFEPPSNFTGIAEAFVKINSNTLTIPLYGLSTQGLEGENEAPLAQVVEALGLKINLGWTTLANHLRPELQGEELTPSLFVKADTGTVVMIPVARYSPDFPLNFGYYTQGNHGPVQHQAGILAAAGNIPEHQTLYPALAEGATSFDPGDKQFGFYATSPGHTLYSEDIWNMLFYPTHATHAIRIYPVRDNTGKTIPNTYLVGMEEAANGDYNDYVFLVKNIKPVNLSEKFTSLFNGENLNGWYTWLEGKGKNNDPEGNFTVANGEIADTGKTLGYIMSEKAYGNYHFTLDFKWGQKRWPPRDNAKRDSGICYNVPAEESDKIWPQSIECQIQEGDVGDFWLIGYSTIQVDKKQNAPQRYSQIVKKKDAEKPTGEWNTVEVISFNGKCVHIVNGVIVNFGENASLIGGKILLQSEYAEVYYRNVKIRELGL